MVRPPDQRSEVAGLGATPALLDRVASAALRDPGATVVDVEVVATGYPFTSIATGGLHRVTGTAAPADGRAERHWSAFVKVVHHPRHWPLLGMMPPQVAAEMTELFPWKDEIEARRQVLPVLPPGLRVPDEYAVTDLGDDRVAWWMEDIDDDDDEWRDEDYARAAHLLGRLAVHRRPGDPAGSAPFPPGFAVRKVVESRGAMLAGLLDDDALWARPVVAGAFDATFRRDLRRAVGTLPALLAEMETLPTALPHGDAAPVNLLRPRGEPGTVVAVDWGFRCQLPLGYDLGQLVAGEVERGRGDPTRLPALLEVVEDAYVEGLAAEGLEVPHETVHRGMICSSLGPRTLPGALPVEDLDGPDTDQHAAYLRRRAGLGRWVLNLLLD